MANKKFGSLVDKPIAYFFAKIDEKLKIKANLVSLLRVKSFFSFDFKWMKPQTKNILR